VLLGTQIVLGRAIALTSEYCKGISAGKMGG